MKIISFDIGINNLSYCIFNIEDDNSSYTILEWDIMNINIDNIKKPSIHYLTKNIIKLFDENSLFLECSKVIIENQPCMKNPIMKSIQIIVYSYFSIRGMTDKKITTEIILMSASNKLKVYNGPPIEINVKSKYTKNKKLAIHHTQYILKDNTLNKEKLDYFNTHKKKDDLADALLQGLYYLKKTLNFEFIN
jgi:hypothetical protein